MAQVSIHPLLSLVLLTKVPGRVPLVPTVLDFLELIRPALSLHILGSILYTRGRRAPEGSDKCLQGGAAP